MKNFFHKISCTIILFLSFICLRATSGRKVIKLARETFCCDDLPRQVHGIDEVIEKVKRDSKCHKSHTNSDGAKFELWTGLYLHHCLAQTIWGFNLAITFYVIEGDKLRCANAAREEILVKNDNGDVFKLRDTEYDVVTLDYVCECKAGKVRACDKLKKQLAKERNILLFFEGVYKELNAGNLEAKMRYQKNGDPVLAIKGRSTGDKQIWFSASWVKAGSEDEMIKDWVNVIQSLAKSSLLVVLRKKASETLSSYFARKNFEYCDQVSYEYLHDIKIAMLTTQMKGLSIH